MALSPSLGHIGEGKLQPSRVKSAYWNVRAIRGNSGYARGPSRPVPTDS